MPLTSSAADVLGVATLVLVLLLVCAGLGCIAYVLYFRARIQKERLPALQVLIYPDSYSQMFKTLKISTIECSLAFVTGHVNLYLKFSIAVNMW